VGLGAAVAFDEDDAEGGAGDVDDGGGSVAARTIQVAVSVDATSTRVNSQRRIGDVNTTG
jgi:hypothetical protein